MKFIPRNIAQLIISIMILSGANAFAQDGSSRPAEQEKEARKVQFNGLGRTLLSNTNIGGALLDTDTTSAAKLTDGEFLLDLAINAQPNDHAEIQGVLRLRNEFGGFFGAGVTVEVRELWARGVIGNVLKYRVGDFDHVMTPYTFYNPDEEGMVNQATIFQARKDVIYYEQWYNTGNQRRLQGANLDIGLEFPVFLDQLQVKPFIARIRPTDFVSAPTRLIGGGRVGLGTQVLQDSLGLKADLGFNIAHTWDDLKSGDANSGIRNCVWSLDYDITVLDKERIGLHIMGEGGRSTLKFLTDETSEFDKDDSFLEAGIAVHFKPARVTLSATYLDIGPDFFSTAAQSKRVDYTHQKTYYDRIGNDRHVRMSSLFDLGLDRALYTFELSDKLMSYDPRYANVMPYGKATPNRTGLQIGAQYAEKSQRFDAAVQAAFLKEIRGQGTFELKDFVLLRAEGNINFDKILSMDKTLRVTLGIQSESTNRDGIEVDRVDLSSTLFDVGLEAELFARFDLLLGGKFMSASGNDYVPLIEEYNEIKDFPAPYLADDTESLVAAGIRYRFKDGVHLNIQYQRFSYSRATTPASDYTLGQVFALYVMEF